MFGRVFNGVVLMVALLTLVACSAVQTQTQPQQPEPPVPSLPSIETISQAAEPGLYTKAFVAEAIRRYDAEGRDAALAYYKHP